MTNLWHCALFWLAELSRYAYYIILPHFPKKCKFPFLDKKSPALADRGNSVMWEKNLTSSGTPQQQQPRRRSCRPWGCCLRPGSLASSACGSENTWNNVISTTKWSSLEWLLLPDHCVVWTNVDEKFLSTSCVYYIRCSLFCKCFFAIPITDRLCIILLVVEINR